MSGSKSTRYFILSSCYIIVVQYDNTTFDLIGVTMISYDDALQQLQYNNIVLYASPCASAAAVGHSLNNLRFSRTPFLVLSGRWRRIIIL